MAAAVIRLGLSLAALAAGATAVAAQSLPAGKVAAARGGMVSSGSSYATAAGVWALEQGGNAAD